MGHAEAWEYGIYVFNGASWSLIDGGKVSLVRAILYEKSYSRYFGKKLLTYMQLLNEKSLA